ncbi:MAG TPA: hypothetical protein VKU60_06525, partial [Chloroflexota bacterium]|nr:hypothetical protein [Chloroflexota bacterium]
MVVPSQPAYLCSPPRWLWLCHRPLRQGRAIPFINNGNCIGWDLTINPKYASPYLFRISGTLIAGTDPLADWAYKQTRRDD